MKKRMTRALGLLVAVVLCLALLPVSAVAAETYDEAKIPVFCYGPNCTADLLDAGGNQLVQIDLTTGKSTELKVPFSDVGEFAYTLKLNNIDNIGSFFKQTEFKFYVDFYYGEDGEVRHYFSSLDKDGKKVKLAELKFIAYTEHYDYSGTYPDEVWATIPTRQNYYGNGTKVDPANPTTTRVKVIGGTWVFKGWDMVSKTIDGADVEFIGMWEFEADSTTTPRPSSTPRRTTNTTTRKLPQTGTNMWLVPVLAASGSVLILFGVFVSRRKKPNER